MCRDTNHNNGEGRRCPCDTSEARQARRVASRARGEFSPTGSTAAVKITPIMEVPATVPEVEGPSIERAKELSAEVQELHTRYEQYFGRNAYIPDGVIEVDGVEYTDLGEAATAMNSLLERRINETGAEINELAALRSGVGETDIQDFYTAEKARLQAMIDNPKQPLTPEKEEELANIEQDMHDLALEQDLFETTHKDDYPHETLSGFHSRIEAHLRENPEDKTAQDLLEHYNRRYLTTRQNYIMQRAGIQNSQLAAANNALQQMARLTSDHGPVYEDIAVMMAKRADAYREIISEIRPMGGVTLNVAADSQKAKTKVLQAALENYPSAWIEASNQAATSVRKLRVKYTGGRAHYSDRRLQKKSKRNPMVRLSIMQPGFEPDPNNYSHYGMVKLEPNERGDYVYQVSEDRTSEVSHYAVSEGESVWVRPYYNAIQTYGSYDRDEPPKRGYVKHVEKVTYRDGTEGERVTWLKQRYEQLVESSEVTAELTVDDSPSGFKGVRGYTTALHEMAHRVESTGSGLIGRMEAVFLERRRETDEKGEKEKLKSIYAGRSEYAYHDKFTSKYMGKVYHGQVHKELLSTGMEAVFGGAYGGLMGASGHRRDTDMRNFILGLVASA